MSFLTCFWLFPQKEHFSRSPPSPMRATGWVSFGPGKDGPDVTPAARRRLPHSRARRPLRSGRTRTDPVGQPGASRGRSQEYGPRASPAEFVGSPSGAGRPTPRPKKCRRPAAGAELGGSTAPRSARRRPPAYSALRPKPAGTARAQDLVDDPVVLRHRRVRILSRSMSLWISSAVLFVWLARMSSISSRMRRISLAWISMSDAWPPPSV